MTTETQHPYTGTTIRTNAWFETICRCGAFAETTDEPGLRHCYHAGEQHYWRWDPEQKVFVFEKAVAR